MNFFQRERSWGSEQLNSGESRGGWSVGSLEGERLARHGRSPKRGGGGSKGGGVGRGREGEGGDPEQGWKGQQMASCTALVRQALMPGWSMGSCYHRSALCPGRSRWPLKRGLEAAFVTPLVVERVRSEVKTFTTQNSRRETGRFLSYNRESS